MDEHLSMDQAFLNKLLEIVQTNLFDEKFGVKELISKAGISKSTIHRKLRTISNKSTSQFIREVRLQNAMEMLQKNAGTVSEIAFWVGFGSPTYFIKCFRDCYGYPPGEVRKKVHDVSESSTNLAEPQIHHKKNNQIKIIQVSSIYYALILFGLFIILNFLVPKEKSIAVLPFINLSDSKLDYLDTYMEDELIYNLYKIESFTKVAALSSVLTYKGTEKRIPKIANELKVNYLIEGTYNKSQDLVIVTIKLIKAKNNKIIWQARYEKPYEEYNSVFSGLSDIALQIATNIDFYLTSGSFQNIRVAENNRRLAKEPADIASNRRSLSFGNTVSINPLQVKGLKDLKSLLAYQAHLFNKQNGNEFWAKSSYNDASTFKEALPKFIQYQPKGINYQTRIRDASGRPITSQPVSMQFNVIKNIPTGLIVYTEKQNVDINQYGVISVIIGNGTDRTGELYQINWIEDNYYLNVKVDPNGGTNYIDYGTLKFLSTPIFKPAFNVVN